MPETLKSILSWVERQRLLSEKALNSVTGDQVQTAMLMGEMNVWNMVSDKMKLLETEKIKNYDTSS